VQDDGTRNQDSARPDQHRTGRGADWLTSPTRSHCQEVPELLDLVQTIHPQCWWVCGRPRVRHGAVTLP
jgi:hypothetical protein